MKKRYVPKHTHLVPSSYKMISIMLCVVLLASLSVAAFAKDYDLSNGDVTVEGNTSTQAGATYDHAANNDYDVKVSGGGSVSVTGETNVAVTVKAGSTVDVNLEDATISTSGNAIKVDNGGSEVTINVSGDNTIEGDHAAFSHGVQVGSQGDTGAGSDVILTGDGTLTIDGAAIGIEVGPQDSLTIDGNEGKLTVNVENSGAGNGQGGEDYSIMLEGELTINNGASVNIDADTEGSTISRGINMKDNAELTISGEGTNVNITGNVGTMGSGIYVQAPTKLKVTDNACLDISISGYDAIHLNATDAEISSGAKVTLKNSGNGHGIQMDSGSSNHTLKISGEGTTVTVTGAGRRGVNAGNNNTVEISDGAVLDVSAVSQQGINTYDNCVITVNDATISAGDREIQLGKDSVLNIEAKAKVTAGCVKSAAARNGAKLIVTGGTLTLTSSANEGLSGMHSQVLYSDATMNDLIVWPTNGDAHGNDKLVNFMLTADEAHALFTTIDANGAAYDYVVDLAKETGMARAETKLSVWVPAAVLSYYFMDQLPADYDFENATENQLLTDLAEIAGKDAVVRGQSIQFGTLSDTFTSLNDQKDVTWSIFADDGSKVSFTASTNVGKDTNAFAVELADEPTPPVRPVPPVNPAPQGGLPHTGDSSNMVLWLSVMLVSASAVVLVATKSPAFAGGRHTKKK